MSSYNYSRELNIGRAGEHLVMFDLLLKGYQAYLTDQGVVYDVVLDLGFRLIRLQVKSTLKPGKMTPTYATDVYKFNVRRAGKKKRSYNPDEFDAYALVTLDTQRVYYYPFEHGFNRTLLFRTSQRQYNQNVTSRARPNIESCTIESCLDLLGIERSQMPSRIDNTATIKIDNKQLNLFNIA